MGLEAATYVNQLVTSNPTGADGKSQGDDHLRLIKQVLQNSFPNITGAMTMTHTQLNATGSPGALNVPGQVMMWYGTEASVPSGWKVCNGTGTISTGVAVPDLRDRFIVGAGSAYALGAIGGSASHTHTATTTVAVLGHALTVSEIPPHTHGINTGLTDVDQGNVGGGRAAVSSVLQTLSTGGGAAHSHGASAGTTVVAGDGRPPYFALFYIIKN